jgi:uncharacterized protein YcfJ
MNLRDFGGRRFIVVIGAGFMSWLLCVFGKISGAEYVTVTVAVVGGFIAGNVGETHVLTRNTKGVADENR